MGIIKTASTLTCDVCGDPMNPGDNDTYRQHHFLGKWYCTRNNCHEVVRLGLVTTGWESVKATQVAKLVADGKIVKP